MIQIADNEGWPFRLLGRLPYRPVDFADWREGNLLFCRAHFFAVPETGATAPEHVGAVLIGDDLTAKS